MANQSGTTISFDDLNTKNKPSMSPRRARNSSTFPETQQHHLKVLMSSQEEDRMVLNIDNVQYQSARKKQSGEA